MKKVEISEDEFVKVCIDFMDNIDIVIGSLKVDDVFMGEEIIRIYTEGLVIFSVFVVKKNLMKLWNIFFMMIMILC